MPNLFGGVVIGQNVGVPPYKPQPKVSPKGGARRGSRLTNLTNNANGNMRVAVLPAAITEDNGNRD